MPQPRILIAEDDPRMLKLVRRTLELEGYQALTASDGREALELALHEPVDLIVLDVMMPEMDGFTVAQKVRAQSQVPILMLTARAAEADIVHGLDSGADDYLLKPFGADELAARVRALLRRAHPPEAPAPPEIVVGSVLVIDLTQRRVHREGTEILLDSHRVPLAGPVGRPSRQGRDPRDAAGAGLGAPVAWRAPPTTRLHRAPAPEDRARPGVAPVLADPPRLRLHHACLIACRVDAPVPPGCATDSSGRGCALCAGSGPRAPVGRGRPGCLLPLTIGGL